MGSKTVEPAGRVDHPGLVDRAAGAVRLIHPFPVAVVVVTSAVLLELAHHGGVALPFLVRACATVLCSQIAVGALNDYVDRFSDALVQPDKPIPSGVASPGTALALVAVGLVGLVPLALSFGVVSFVLIAAGTAGGLGYDLVLKRTPFSVLGYIVGFLLLATWIWSIAGRLSLGFLILYPAGSLLVTAAHLAQSLPDIETDREVNARGLAVALGVKRSVLAILLCYLALTLGTITIALRAGVPLLALAPLAGMGLVVGAAGRLRSSGYTRAARLSAFKALAPALGAIAVSAAIACIRLGIL